MLSRKPMRALSHPHHATGIRRARLTATNQRPVRLVGPLPHSDRCCKDCVEMCVQRFITQFVMLMLMLTLLVCLGASEYQRPPGLVWYSLGFAPISVLTSCESWAFSIDKELASCTAIQDKVESAQDGWNQCTRSLESSQSWFFWVCIGSCIGQLAQLFCLLASRYSSIRRFERGFMALCCELGRNKYRLRELIQDLKAKLGDSLVALSPILDDAERILSQRVCLGVSTDQDVVSIISSLQDTFLVSTRLISGIPEHVQLFSPPAEAFNAVDASDPTPSPQPISQALYLGQRPESSPHVESRSVLSREELAGFEERALDRLLEEEGLALGPVFHSGPLSLFYAVAFLLFGDGERFGFDCFKKCYISLVSVCVLRLSQCIGRRLPVCSDWSKFVRWQVSKNTLRECSLVRDLCLAILLGIWSHCLFPLSGESKCFLWIHALEL